MLCYPARIESMSRFDRFIACIDKLEQFQQCNAFNYIILNYKSALLQRLSSGEAPARVAQA
jgi:hypothetical protein